MIKHLSNILVTIKIENYRIVCSWWKVSSFIWIIYLLVLFFSSDLSNFHKIHYLRNIILINYILNFTPIDTRGMGKNVWNDLSNLVKFYENCVLQTDGFRFKKSKYYWSSWFNCYLRNLISTSSYLKITFE